MAKIAILGTGAWGTALANVLLTNSNNVFMWGIDQNEINDLKHGVNAKYYGQHKLINKLDVVGCNIHEVLQFNPDYVIIAVPSIHIENTIQLALKYLTNKPVFINVAKGFDQKTKKTWSITIEKLIKNKAKGLVTLIGPSFAIEVFNKEITIVNTVSKNKTLATKVAKIFQNNYFKCVAINDVIGAETISALKNVMAIGSGILYSQHTSINTRSAILAQMTKEISLIVKVLGGKTETVYQYCGIGDIFLTCTDSKSRNFSFGQAIGQKGFKQICKELKIHTVEGYWATQTAHEIIKKYKLHAPVIEHVYNVLYKNEDAKKFVYSIFKEVKF
ncbi:MAG: NAD(P)-binding domain-containing protein [Mycoplasma sp.]